MRIALLLMTLPVCLATTAQNLTKAKNAISPFNYLPVKNITVKNGAVASAHPLASWAGVKALQQGGNAIDAAIAVQWALAVVYPSAGNIGGGGFLVAAIKNKAPFTIDYRETAPGKASRDMYLDSAGNAIAEKSLFGALASGVPGSVAGIFASHQYAKLPMKALLSTAIELAAKGFVITEREASSLNSLKQYFMQYSTTPTAFVKDIPWKAGDTLIQKDLAQTLIRIRDHGADGFYKGETADLIVAEMQRGGGIISHEDLAAYKARFREPHTFNYRGFHIVGMPMPSSGGLLLHQMLKMIAPYKVGQLKFQSPKAVNLMVEAERRAFADRARYMGDADFVTVPVKALTADSYLQSRMKDFKWDIAGNSTLVKEGVVNGYESEETTHLSVVDKEGNAVSVTTTLNNSYGSRTVVGGAGFILNDEMDDFSVKPGSPNMYGAVGGKANAIAPHKRMLSSMTPTIVLKNNRPYLVVGTPGGTTIPTSVFQTIVNIIDFNMTARDAVFAPKFHHQWLPDRVDIEKGFNSQTKTALEKMGYTLYDRSQIGRVELIKILPGNLLEAVADNRGDDGVVGY